MDAECKDATARAIRDSFSSPNVSDSNLEPANIVDVVADLANATRKVARSIYPDAAGGPGANDGHVESLTEAVVDVAVSLRDIAIALSDIAEAIRERGDE